MCHHYSPCKKKRGRKNSDKAKQTNKQTNKQIIQTKPNQLTLGTSNRALQTLKQNKGEVWDSKRRKYLALIVLYMDMIWFMLSKNYTNRLIWRKNNPWLDEIERQWCNWQEVISLMFMKKVGNFKFELSLHCTCLCRILQTIKLCKIGVALCKPDFL